MNESQRKPSQTFKDVIAWQKAHQFVLAVYLCTKDFPREEMYGLTSQFRRAAVSIAANIAEGFKKATKPDKLRFLNTPQGSVEECRYYLILSKDLGYGDNAACAAMLEEASRLIEAYSAAIRRSQD